MMNDEKTPRWEKAIRDHEKEHGPSGSAWNISMILERLRQAYNSENKIP